MINKDSAGRECMALALVRHSTRKNAASPTEAITSNGHVTVPVIAYQYVLKLSHQFPITGSVLATQSEGLPNWPSWKYRGFLRIAQFHTIQAPMPRPPIAI